VGGLSWMVDGQPLGRGDELVVWEPVPGRHAVTLVDSAHGVVDVVRFEVRGAASGARTAHQKTSASAGDRLYSGACETPERCSD
jgi:penicillin-binding protein 1C